MSKLPSLMDDKAPQSGANSNTKDANSKPPVLERLRHAVATPTGRAVFGIVILAALAFGGYRIFGAVNSGGADWPRIRVMDPETRDLRWQDVRPGATMPYVNPRTGERSMYVVEYCFANECGPAGGTPAVLNNYLDKEGPTICTKCGATVTAHNPRPAEYASVQPADW